MMTETQKLVRKEFRKYLRTEKSIKRSFLDSLIDAMDNHIASLLKLCGIDLRSSIYDDIYSVNDLQKFLRKIKSDEAVLAAPHGFATSLALQHYITFFCKTHDISIPDGEVQDDDNLTEGEEEEFRGIRYERSVKAHAECIAHFGCVCQVCGFNFEKVYGEWGKNYIEVHHIVPLSERGEAYVVNPKTDLIPLCSNCHSMIHKERHHTLTISELKDKLQKPGS